jgi:hypothetical protein
LKKLLKEIKLWIYKLLKIYLKSFLIIKYYKSVKKKFQKICIENFEIRLMKKLAKKIDFSRIVENHQTLEPDIFSLSFPG